MTSQQNATVARGATLRMVITLTDAGGEPLPPSTPLYYRVAREARSPSLLYLPIAAATVDDATVVEVTLAREQTLTLPTLTLYHEVYTVDGDPAMAEDDVLMTGTLTVIPAQIARHPDDEA
jgi:hypothetical protein